MISSQSSSTPSRKNSKLTEPEEIQIIPWALQNLFEVTMYTVLQ